MMTIHKCNTNILVTTMLDATSLLSRIHIAVAGKRLGE